MKFHPIPFKYLKQWGSYLVFISFVISNMEWILNEKIFAIVSLYILAKTATNTQVLVGLTLV